MSTVISIGYRERQKIRPSQSEVTVSKGVDYFDKVVGADGSRFQLGSDTLQLPATKEVEDALNRPISHNAQPGVIDYEAAIFYNGIPFYNGFARYNTAQRTHRPSSYSMRLIGNGRDFWEQCAGLSMHDLDLGIIPVNRLQIKASWAGTYPGGWRHVFAPVLYGKPTGLIEPDDVTPAFADEDFRPHVYFPAIVAAIGEATGYRIIGQILELPIFRDAVYLCTRKAADIRQVLPPYCQVALLRTTTKAFANGTAIDFNSVSGCSYISSNASGSSIVATVNTELRLTLNMTGSTLDEILVYVNGVHDGVKFTATNSSYISQVITLSVEAGDVITFLALGTGGGITVSFAALYMERVFDPNVIAGKDVYLATALHPHNATQFLNAIAHMYGLLYIVDAKTKTVTVKPRFNFKIGSTLYRGHYDILPTPKTISAGQDDISYQADDYFGKYIELSYKQEGQYLFTALSSANQQDCPVAGSRMDIDGTQGAGTSSANPLFAYLPQYKYAEFSSLPAILGDDFDGASTDLPEVWTGEGVITCGLLYRGNATIQYDEGNGVRNQYDVPWISQYIRTSPNAQPLEKEYHIAYCDAGKIPGLVSIFYWQYLACVRNPETAQFATNMDVAQFDAFNFSGTYTARMGGGNMIAWIALSITGYNPAANQGQVTILKIRPITSDVIAAIENYNGQ